MKTRFASPVTPIRQLVFQRLATLGISQAEAARRAGVNTQFINDLMTGKKANIRPESAFQIALAIQVPPIQVLRALGLVGETHPMLYTDSDRLEGALLAPLQIQAGLRGEFIEAADNFVLVVGRPFRS